VSPRRTANPDPSELRAELRSRLNDGLLSSIEDYRRRGQVLDPTDERVLAQAVLAQEMRAHAAERLARGEAPLSVEEEDVLARAVFDDAFGAGVLDRYLSQPGITDLTVNGPDVAHVVDTEGRRRRIPGVARDDEELADLIRTLARSAGARVDAAAVELNFSLPDGSRVFASLGGVSPHPVLAIRRHPQGHLANLEELAARGLAGRDVIELLRALVLARKNVVFSGGTGAGKTTVLRASANEIEPDERIITIEDTYELGLHNDPEGHPEVVAFLARPANLEGTGEVTMAQLTRMALRAGPDRVIVGEVRGPEVIPMLDAMTQGNDGSMGTVHASSSKAAFSRLASYAVRAGLGWRFEDALFVVGSAVDFVVHVTRQRSGEGWVRRVSSIREVTGADAGGAVVSSNEIYAPGPDGVARATGVPLSPESTADLSAAGWDPDTLARAGTWR
jgi:pilus assembly protein CpaF